MRQSGGSFASLGVANAFTKAQAVTPDSDTTALVLTANAAQTNPVLTVNAVGQASPYQQWQGINRGNGTRYMTQVGGMGSAQPFVVTNTFVLINGQANEPFLAADLTVATEGTYMFAVRSDVGAAPAVVFQGGDNTGPILRGYSFGGTKVLEAQSSGQLLLPATSGASSGLVMGGDANLYRTTVIGAPVLRTDYPLYAKSLNSDAQAANTLTVDLRATTTGTVDPNARFTINNAGSISWGPGSSALDMTLQRSGSLVALAVTGGDLAMNTSGKYFRWAITANTQTTVGAAGTASALPTAPTKYLKVKDDAGTVLVIPAYAAS